MIKFHRIKKNNAKNYKFKNKKSIPLNCYSIQFKNEEYKTILVYYLLNN